MSQMSEEQKMELLKAEANKNNILVNRQIPYAIFNHFIGDSTLSSYFNKELTQIAGFYKVYRDGNKFEVEGTNGDYVASTLKYKMIYSLINKEARFLFGNSPDINIKPKKKAEDFSDKDKLALSQYIDFLTEVLSKNMIEGKLIKAAKDCFIGKRVAGIVNFNEDDGITINFLPSLNFYFETKDDNPEELRKFVGVSLIKDSTMLVDKRYFAKYYEKEGDNVYLTEKIFDGASQVKDVITDKQELLIKNIPAVIFVNDGLSGEELGESEVEGLLEYERYFSKLSNADIDAERKGMNPIRYTVDMDNKSTENLPSGAGSQWDLISDQNLEKPSPKIGTLESGMNYSSPLKTTLERIKNTAYEQLDMPDISNLQAKLTSGKALKAIYWSLITRCDEKMKMWGPNLRKLMNILIDGALQYTEIQSKYTDGYSLDSTFRYSVEVLNNSPILEDENEEKQMDLGEVSAKVMSRKSYMKKWRGMTDSEIDEELTQIAKERQVVEDTSFVLDPNDNFKDDVGVEQEPEEPEEK